jgi:hypothetical protein
LKTLPSHPPERVVRVFRKRREIMNVKTSIKAGQSTAAVLD